MVRLTVVLSASARGAQDLVEALRFLMVSTRPEPGCLGCTVRVNPDSAVHYPDSAVHYEEEWATEEDMRRRVRSDRFTSLLAVVESVQAPPRVQFDFVTTSRGLDYVAEVRNEVVP